MLDEWIDAAGAYKIQGYGGVFVKEINAAIFRLHPPLYVQT
jgi:predicted house-cleaning NTP pyrophosphatase (Maf/HAM1 superfamily)